MSDTDDPRCALCRDLGSPWCNECAIDVAAAHAGGASDTAALHIIDGDVICTNWRDSCHGDPEIDECVCESRRRAYCSVCGRRVRPVHRTSWFGGRWTDWLGHAFDCARRGRAPDVKARP